MKVADFKPQLTLTKRGVTSGGSRQFFFFKNKLPLKIKIRGFALKLTSKAGRNNLGAIVVNSKKSLPNNFKKPKVNYCFRSTNLFFIANIVMIPKINKLFSVTVLSSGAITYLPSTTYHEFFKLTRFQGLLKKKWDFTQSVLTSSPLLKFQSIGSIILKLPKNKPISLIESLPGRSISFTRSPGSSSYILKRNSLTGTALIRLSSGVKKIFSVYSLGSNGNVGLLENKKCKINKAGFYQNFGKKSTVRGIAKNPVDHPHGGRTKAIKYQRTPWGKTTKFK